MMRLEHLDGTVSMQVGAGLVARPPDPVFPGVFRCSESSLCQRKIAYGWLAQPESDPPGPSEQEKMDRGDVLHDYIRQHLIPNHSDFTVTECERPVGGRYGAVQLWGHIDGVLCRRGKPLALLDIKTTSDWGFGSTVKAGFLDPTHYSFSYLRQLTLYLGLLRRDPAYATLSRTVVFLYNCNGKAVRGKAGTTWGFKDYWFDWDEADFDREVQRRGEIERTLSDGLLPFRAYLSPEDWGCRLCRWKQACWTGGDAVDPGLLAAARNAHPAGESPDR